jgi:hypothetical protein
MDKKKINNLMDIFKKQSMLSIYDLYGKGINQNVSYDKIELDLSTDIN